MLVSVGESGAQFADEVVGRLEALVGTLKEACTPLRETLEQMEWHMVECPEAPDLFDAEDLLEQFSNLENVLEQACPLFEKALQAMHWNEVWKNGSAEEQIAAMRRRADWLQAAGNRGDARLWRWEATRRETDLKQQRLGTVAS
jgi:hypothetical protein